MASRGRGQRDWGDPLEIVHLPTPQTLITQHERFTVEDAGHGRYYVTDSKTEEQWFILEGCDGELSIEETTSSCWQRTRVALLQVERVTRY